MGQGKLTVKKVRATSEPGLYGDGNTLFMRAAPGGSKQWVQRPVIRGKRRDIGRRLQLGHARQSVRGRP